MGTLGKNRRCNLEEIGKEFSGEQRQHTQFIPCFFSESRRRKPGWLAKGRNWWDPWSEERDNELFVSNFLPPTRVSSSRPRFQPKRGLGPDSCSTRMIVEEEERGNAFRRRNLKKKFQINIILYYTIFTIRWAGVWIHKESESNSWKKRWGEKHHKNCESCQSHVTWKVKFKCQFCLSCLSFLSCPSLLLVKMTCFPPTIQNEKS